MGVNVYSALSVHESAYCKYEEGNVGALASFVDVEPPDVIVVIEVV